MIAGWCCAMFVAASVAMAPLGGGDIDGAMQDLDGLVSSRWQQEMNVDLTLLGLEDGGRREAAMELVDAILVLTEQIDAALRAQSAAGGRISSHAGSWRVNRGIACAAEALLNDLHRASAAEAIRLLRDVEPRMDGGRGRRLFAMLLAQEGRADEALHAAVSLPDDPSVSPYERVASSALQLHLRSPPERAATAAALLRQADGAWSVALLGESVLATAETLEEAYTWAKPIREAFGRCGVSPADHLELVAAMVERLPGIGDFQGTSVDAAVRVGAARAHRADGRVTEAEAWLRNPGDCDGPDRAALHIARARCAEERGDLLAAVAEWHAAAETASGGGGLELDHAAGNAMQFIRDGGDSRAVMAVLEEAALRGAARSTWIMAVASIEAHHGNLGPAIERLQTMPPRGRSHLHGLAKAANLIRRRRLEDGQWHHTDEDALMRMFAAAAAAAEQQGDPVRAATAIPVAAVLAQVDIERLIDIGEIDVAAGKLDGPRVRNWLAPADAQLLEAKLAAARGDRSGLRVAVSKAGDGHARDIAIGLLTWAASSGESAALLAIVVDVIEQPQVGVGETNQLLVAEALRAAGRCDWALPFYTAVLSRTPDLVPAVFGRSECFRLSEDRQELAEAAAGYRRVAAMPRDADPDRWRLANTRLLEVLRRAGADPARLDAKLARLRRIDPEIGSTVTSSEAHP